MVLFFVSEAFASYYQELNLALKDRFPDTILLGCSASGLAGAGRETEFVPGLALLAGRLPEVGLHPFFFEELPDADSPPSAWRDCLGCQGVDLKGILLLADPFSFDAEGALAGLDFAFPEVAKVGGLVSGCQQPGEAALFLGSEIFRQGCVGLGFSGAMEMVPAVAQGCEAIGEQMVVTDARSNVLVELDGKPATQALVDTLEGLSPDKRRAAQRTLFVGLGAGRFALKYEPGEFLVRQVLGIDPRTGSIMVGARLRTGQTVQFHLRDAGTSAADLRSVLQRSRDRLGSSPPEAALLFSCLGRGRSLYGELGHDSTIFYQVMGPVPMAGFFCNGEFGPVGGQSALHGFTSSFALFRRT